MMTLEQAKLILNTYQMPMTSLQLKLFKQAFNVVSSSVLAPPTQQEV